MAMLEKEGLIRPSPGEEGGDDEKMDKARARFLRGSSRLDKRLVGEWISRLDGGGLLKAFIGLFDFSGVS
jgi:brefeldin A-resistance guanine nucleotide exchange factor 1